MTTVVSVTFGFAADALFATYLKLDRLPKAIRSIVFGLACWFLLRKYAVRDLVKLRRLIAEEGRGKGDRIQWWGDWE